ncbi:MAG: beta-mannosidase [Kiritimatiellae bacterium]|nr:beta-mannosidase [Kiritimatiellia bacterium]MDD5520806.1 beta-mannosidase [Kiritimatiellia bacterium]
MNTFRILILSAFLVNCSINVVPAEQDQSGQRQLLADGWLLKSSVLVPEDGAQISTSGYKPRKWLKATMPSTVLSTLVKNGIYPDPRNGLDCFKIPDSSDEFNKKYDLAKFSYLPDRRNPWRDPYWYRTEFKLSKIEQGRHLWLNFNCINYRADVWFNGKQIADRDTMAGMFQRFRFDITQQAQVGCNALAVKIHPVDHPGVPDAQLDVYGRSRGEHKEIELDVTMIETVGYDCMMTVPDRNMGICQEVYLDWTGPVDIRHPFVITELPLPDTSHATLTVSAELINSGASPVRGVLHGRVAGTDVKFEQPVELAPNETKLVRVEPKPVMQKPRLWWPVNYGEQYLYDLDLQFATNGTVSTEQKVKFGVRQITCEMHKLEEWHGRRVFVNGQKVFCRGGYIQPELLLDWDAQRIEEEIRYFANANMNLIYFEDIPNPPDVFLEMCDKYGVLFGNCFYACSWVTKPGRPEDIGLLERCTADVLKRYRNHPSLVMYMSMDEGYTCQEVYSMWRRNVIALDGSRFWIPSGYFPDFHKGESTAKAERFAHFREDLPTGMNDLGNKSYQWQEPVTYFRWVREDRSWMFKIESGSASLPPISSLAKFIPDLGAYGTNAAAFPLTETWAHHGANHYYKPYDQAIRRLHGEPETVADYCWKAHLITADQHRSFYEAVNHRMWDITSGFTEWKINSCYPDVQWQNFDYYHKPVISHFFIKKACEPVHVQMELIDYAVSVINCRLEPQSGLEVTVRVFDLESKPLWQRTDRLDVSANSYREVFSITGLTNLAPFVFVKLELKNNEGCLVSDNFYWLRGRDTQDYRILQRLPMVKLESTLKMENCDNERLAHVKVVNPTSNIAFFIQLALTRGSRGEEILPVMWEDNYFSLLPGETRELTARVAEKNLGSKKPKLEVGGWNIQTDYRCRKLTPSKFSVKADEEITIKADIADTFLDGSRVTLLADGQPVHTKWAWARGKKSDEVSFKLKFSQPGTHRLMVGKYRNEVIVE